MFKKNVDFEGVFKEAYSLVKDKKFNKAVIIYNKINNCYKELSEEKKTLKLKQDLAVLYKELSLYLRINEAYSLAQKGNFDLLNEEIQQIHDLTYELKSEREKSPLIEYGEKHYEFFLDVYTYKVDLNEFENKHEEVLKLLDEHKVDECMKEFSQLVILYNKLYNKLDHDKKLELYAKLKTAYRDISIKKLYSLSREKPRVIPGKPIVNETKKVKAENKLGENPVSVNSFKDLHEMIKKGDYSRALEFYENL